MIPLLRTTSLFLLIFVVWGGGKNNNSDLIYCTCFDLSRLASRSALGGVWYSILLWAVCLSPQTDTWTSFGGVFDPGHHSSRPLSLTFTSCIDSLLAKKPRVLEPDSVPPTRGAHRGLGLMCSLKSSSWQRWFLLTELDPAGRYLLLNPVRAGHVSVLA